MPNSTLRVGLGAIATAAVLLPTSAVHAVPSGNCTGIGGNPNQAFYAFGRFFIQDGDTAPDVTSVDCTIGDKTFSNLNFTAYGAQANINGLVETGGGFIDSEDTVTFEYIPLSDEYKVSFNFAQGANASFVPTTAYDFTYDLEITQAGQNAGYKFATFTASSDPNNSVTSTTNPATIAGTTFATTTSTVAATNDGANSFNVAVTQFIPTSPVPGPLPLAGAAMAFGFSRRLRKRLHHGS